MKNKTKKILDFLNSMDWMFGIQNFTRSIILKKEDNGKIRAEILFDETYQNVVVRIYPEFFKDSPKEQRKTLLHELCHAITLQAKGAMHKMLDGKLITPDQIMEINEMETSKIENLLDLFLSNKMTYAKKAYQKYIK